MGKSEKPESRPRQPWQQDAPGPGQTARHGPRFLQLSSIISNRPERLKRGKTSSTGVNDPNSPFEDADEIWEFIPVWAMITNPQDELEIKVSLLMQQLCALASPGQYSFVRQKIMKLLRERRLRMPEDERERWCAWCGLPLGFLSKADKIEGGRIVARASQTRQHFFCTEESNKRNFEKDKRTKTPGPSRSKPKKGTKTRKK